MRPLLRIAPLVLLILAAAASAMAQDAWPVTPVPGEFRGPGFYLSWLKILLCWLLFLAWVRTTDWINTDCQEYHFPHNLWNSVAFGSFMGAMVLLWVLPWFWLGFPLLVIAYAAPLAAYVYHHNTTLGGDEQVLTRKHLRYMLATQLGKLGVKMSAEAPAKREAGPPIKLTPRNADEEALKQRLTTFRASRGVRAAHEMVAEGMLRRATATMLDFTPNTVGVRYLVDGVWNDAEPLPRQTGDQILEALKLLAGLDPQERSKRQEGPFAATYDEKLHAGTLTTQGVQTGERVVLQFETKDEKFENFEALGMRAKMQEQVKEILARPNGMVLLSAIPGGGLRTTTNILLRSADRFLREFAALEDADSPYLEVENVNVTTYKQGQGETPHQKLVVLLRTEPNVIVVRDLVDAQMVDILSKCSVREQMSVTTIRAKDSAEALLRVLALKANPAEFAKAIAAVLSQRLVRKLCEKCKEAYTPTPDLLKQLNIPEGRIPALYRPTAPKPVEPGKKRKAKDVCQECGGIGYKGRTAIYELLVVDDTIRKILQTTPKLDLLRQAARKAGMRSLQEEGILLAARGVTSLQELQRALK